MESMDWIEIQPCKWIDGEVEIPGSKSITNRALLLASLASLPTSFSNSFNNSSRNFSKKTVLRNVLWSEDTRIMYSALQSLGLKLKWLEDRIENIIEVEYASRIFSPEKPLYLGNAGTAFRFLTSFVCLGDGEFVLTGSQRMKDRPIKDLVDSLRSLGANIEYLEKEGCPPLKIQARGLMGGHVNVLGNWSSQYISSLLMSAPFIRQDLSIQVSGERVSEPYIDLTLKMMEDFGVTVNQTEDGFFVPANQHYSSVQQYWVEADASSASYFFAMASITGGRVRVFPLNFSSMQGDLRFIWLLKEMGSTVQADERSVEVKGKALYGIDVDMRDISDLVPTLAVVALFVHGKTTIRNVGHIRIKESDRLTAVSVELKKLGAHVEETDSSISIFPQKNYQPAMLHTYDDHRLAMAFSLAGLMIPGVRIQDPECVAKTFPDYFQRFQALCERSIR